MIIVPNDTYEVSPRQELVMEIMLLLDHAVQCDEQLTTTNLADRIVDLVENVVGEIADHTD